MKALNEGKGYPQRLTVISAWAFMVAGLLFSMASARAAPRVILPPMPETAPLLYYEGFNEAYAPGLTNSQITVGHYTLAESWSGYALQRSGSTVTPFVVPALNSTGSVKIACTSGAIRFWFKPYWSSATTNGAGPGVNARLVELAAAGQSQSLVVWSLQVSPDGTALALIGESDNGPVVLLQTTVRWPAGQSHLITLDYSTNRTALFIDGQLAAEGAGAMAIPPSVGQLVLGSTLSGLNAAGGDFDEVFSFSRPLRPAEVTFYYNGVSPLAALGPITPAELAQRAALFAAARQRQAAQLSATMANEMEPMSLLDNCPTGGPVYMTNLAATLNPDQTMTVTFDVVGGTNGLLYDVFATTNLLGSGGGTTNAPWVWLGQTPTCSAFTATNQWGLMAFYLLGTPQDTDGDALTDAYEILVSHTDPTGFNVSIDGYGTPNAWYLAQGINPQIPGVGSLDPDQDGLLNWQEYQYGTQPLVSEGFGVWVSAPTGLSGIP